MRVAAGTAAEAVTPSSGVPRATQTQIVSSGRRGRSSSGDTVVTASLVALVVLGATLRLWDLGAHRLGYDEAFTAMAGRMPLGSLFSYLRAHDSHPPLDYLLRAPFARAGASEFLLRLPSALCSIGALVAFAIWVRRYRVAGVVATGVLALSAFQIDHGRTARMYAELELLGVLGAILAYAWLRRPRRWHAPAMGLLVLVVLLTHVSGFLLGAGLLALAGLRTDREAWRWRGALAAAGVGWAAVWGASFIVQSGGGHSSWIPRTTLDGFVVTVGALVTRDPALALGAVVAVVTGSVLVGCRDRDLARVLVCVSFTPILLAATAGTVAPVLIDRTLTVAAWGAPLAIGFLVAGLLARRWIVGVVAIAVLAIVMVPASVGVVSGWSNPDAALRHLENVVRPGDVVAIRPAGKLPEIAWSIGVRGTTSYRRVTIPGLRHAAGFIVGDRPASGRLWLLDWAKKPIPFAGRHVCAPTWALGSSRVVCLQ